MESIGNLEYSNRFLKKLSRLPARIIREAEKKERLFKSQPFHSLLRTHKLHGKDRGAWAFWIDYRYRIKFIFVSKNRVLFLDVGLHDIYD